MPNRHAGGQAPEPAAPLGGQRLARAVHIAAHGAAMLARCRRVAGAALSTRSGPPPHFPSQVLRKAFPGVLLEPDICALRVLPEVRLQQASCGPYRQLLSPKALFCEGTLYLSVSLSGLCQPPLSPDVPTSPAQRLGHGQGTELLAAAPPSAQSAGRSSGAAGVDESVSA